MLTEKKEKNSKKIFKEKWSESNNFVLAVYQRYLNGRLSKEQVMQIFKGRTWHAIYSKVYNIKGTAKKKKVNPLDGKQYSFPFGGEICESRENNQDN